MHATRSPLRTLPRLFPGTSIRGAFYACLAIALLFTLSASWSVAEAEQGKMRLGSDFPQGAPKPVKRQVPEFWLETNYGLITFKEALTVKSFEFIDLNLDRYNVKELKRIAKDLKGEWLILSGTLNEFNAAALEEHQFTGLTIISDLVANEHFASLVKPEQVEALQFYSRILRQGRKPLREDRFVTDKAFKILTLSGVKSRISTLHTIGVGMPSQNRLKEMEKLSTLGCFECFFDDNALRSFLVKFKSETLRELILRPSFDISATYPGPSVLSEVLVPRHHLERSIWIGETIDLREFEFTKEDIGKRLPNLESLTLGAIDGWSTGSKPVFEKLHSIFIYNQDSMQPICALGLGAKHNLETFVFHRDYWVSRRHPDGTWVESDSFTGLPESLAGISECSNLKRLEINFPSGWGSSKQFVTFDPSHLTKLETLHLGSLVALKELPQRGVRKTDYYQHLRKLTQAVGRLPIKRLTLPDATLAAPEIRMLQRLSPHLEHLTISGSSVDNVQLEMSLNLREELPGFENLKSLRFKVDTVSAKTHLRPYEEERFQAVVRAALKSKKLTTLELDGSKYLPISSSISSRRVRLGPLFTEFEATKAPLRHVTIHRLDEAQNFVFEALFRGVPYISAHDLGKDVDLPTLVNLAIKKKIKLRGTMPTICADLPEAVEDKESGELIFFEALLNAKRWSESGFRARTMFFMPRESMEEQLNAYESDLMKLLKNPNPDAKLYYVFPRSIDFRW